ncbi:MULTISPECIES: HNH endonuclease signature motif containing protein [unclassified Variovorax]|uniref:HNH endonuclease n=1 Tax=unclassified Variovorax TaxID=663243 RepID=UPI00076C1346|nr:MULTISPECIES: HNH endonuclease signature motif containing protein [unclassified Variovorax]KWT73968.1 hypothetical protein APY03_5819 [Variovorax sp. WDL1]PNG52305.1 hypothetical protein CHC07_04677 [Variovorax sp. B4]PNG54845.1 hypothetical protein CHC06_03643 [Variovorax sp. B2]VTV15856.1 HNH endonuclease [Variovorax sp. WDL1]
MPGPAQVEQRIRGKALQYLRRRVLERDGYLCQCPLCQAGQPLKLTSATAEVDHIVPLYQGGTNQMTNLRALHIDCHARITAEQAQARYQGWKP